MELTYNEIVEDLLLNPHLYSDNKTYARDFNLVYYRIKMNVSAKELGKIHNISEGRVSCCIATIIRRHKNYLHSIKLS